MITYNDDVSGITTKQLNGFFVGWPKPPSPETLLRLLWESAYVWLAIDDESGNVIGFVSAISDGVLSAYIPLLEVLPEYQGRGIGTELLKRMLETTKDLYMVDLVCDPEKQSFYQRLGFKSYHAMFIRRMDRQSGA